MHARRRVSPMPSGAPPAPHSAGSRVLRGNPIGGVRLGGLDPLRLLCYTSPHMRRGIARGVHPDDSRLATAGCERDERRGHSATGQPVPEWLSARFASARPIPKRLRRDFASAKPIQEPSRSHFGDARPFPRRLCSRLDIAKRRPRQVDPGFDVLKPRRNCFCRGFAPAERAGSDSGRATKSGGNHGHSRSRHQHR